jgi:hypothetical protein
LKIIFQQLLSFFCQQHPFFSPFQEIHPFCFESTAASTLAAAVSTAHPFLFYCFGSVFYFVVSFFLQETSTKVATRANPKMLSSCFVF